MRPVITLTTDFGLDDPFVGIMKGVILNIVPDAQIVDITHNIEPQNITQAALILNATYPWFPRKTIHVVVVDPGVGGGEKNTGKAPSKKAGGPGPVIRRAMVVQSKFQTFVGPDNGVLTPALHSDSRVYEITNKKYFLKDVSNTFHGRDVFAPCAGWIASGVQHSKMGPRVLKPVRQDFSQPQLKGATLHGEIIHIDHFGNLRAMVVQSKFQTFVGPDNGVLTPALHSDSRVYEITNKKYFLKDVSNTFHGRDVFAPCAGWIASGVQHSKMGPRVLKPVRQDFSQPQLKGATLHGEIIHIDHFGNLTTNISAELIHETFISSDTIKVQIGKHRINGLVSGYYQMKSGQPGAVINSWNHLEIFYREDSAKKKLKAMIGQSVTLKAN